MESGNYYDALTGSKVVIDKGVAGVKFDANGVAVITRSKDIHPQMTISERDCSFTDDLEVTMSAKNYDEGYYWFNNDKSGKTDISNEVTLHMKDHVVDGKVDLHVYLRKGVNVFEQTFTYKKMETIEGRFNVLNLDPSYLNGDYELYIWSWLPGRWSKDYEIKDGVMLVDTTGMTGFLIAVFPKGYEITNLNEWDSNVIKQTGDIKDDVLRSGFIDLSGF